MNDFEVIVSDNDPEQSSRQVVEQFCDPRFKYRYNETNVGMVKNFNIALSHAIGKYVVMITDDDPIYPIMLSTVHKLVEDNPGYGAYFGACDISLENPEVAKTYASVVGLKSCLAASVSVGTIRRYLPSEFLPAFFKRSIFPYMLWSTGAVRRDIAIKIGGMPDYGSPFFTDFTYLALAGAESGFVAINLSLGYQAVHGDNSGFSHPHSLQSALSGSHELLSDRLSGRNDWQKIRPLVERYLAGYIIGHVVAMRRYFSGQRHSQHRELYLLATREIFQQDYIRRLKWRYYAILIMDYFPFVRSLYTRLKALGSRL